MAKLLNSQINSTVEGFNNEAKAQINQLSVEELKIKASELLNKLNDPETERDFRKTCSLYDSKISDPTLSKAFQEYVDAYHHATSIYQIAYDSKKHRALLIIYDTERERKETKILKTPEYLTNGTCIARLPNGELFCYGTVFVPSGITLIIDKNLKVRKLPSGAPSFASSAIYLNRSVYCFGRKKRSYKASTLSRRFDLDKNRWIKLTPMPRNDYSCHSVIFNGNILISGWMKNLLLYSTDIDSFSTISYEFQEIIVKTLIKTERLYLIEHGEKGFIYESDVGDEYAWKKIGNSIISTNYPYQMSYLYNKETIYVGFWESKSQYLKFNLDLKVLTWLQEAS